MAPLTIGASTGRVGRRMVVVMTTLLLLLALLPATAGAQSTDDPRAGLAAGYDNAGEASEGMDLIGRADKREGVEPGEDSLFFDENDLNSSFGGFPRLNSDLAFTGDHAIQGNFGGFQILDLSDPTDPDVRTQVVCPGGQHDTTVYGHLLFVSVESTSARVDCGPQGAGPASVPNPDRFRGVRIFDISDLDSPVQVGAVQTCRGSHTHRMVEDLDDPSTVYIYNSGTSSMRSSGELARCNLEPADGDDPARWMIEVIEVPVDSPQDAAIVNEARLFTAPETGALNGLQNGPTQPLHPSGVPYSPNPDTNTCHDITAYPEIGLAAGACQGNGILIDISDPANPVRLDAVADPNFSYWHSAIFNNDGTAVLFTDEWGGGTGARCRTTDQLSWGANALFEIVQTDDGPKLEFQSYYKMPAAQTTEENCVAHQANIVPVPGRDIMVQAWYQGGISMFDWTDPANPVEIGYFDRGPIRDDLMVLGGFWSGYWYNGNVFGSEIARGFDAFDLIETDQLSDNEIAAAKTVQLDEHNAMSMRRITWEPSFPVVRAHFDQLDRAGGMNAGTANRVTQAIDRAERFADGPQRRAAVANLEATANQLKGGDQQALADAMRDLAAALR